MSAVVLKFQRKQASQAVRTRDECNAYTSAISLNCRQEIRIATQAITNVPSVTRMVFSYGAARFVAPQASSNLYMLPLGQFA
jgi:hypothetical protein